MRIWQQNQSTGFATTSDVKVLWSIPILKKNKQQCAFLTIRKQNKRHLSYKYKRIDGRVIINCHFLVSHWQCESDLPKLPSLYSYLFTATSLIQCLHCNIFSNVSNCNIFPKAQSLFYWNKNTNFQGFFFFFCQYFLSPFLIAWELQHGRSLGQKR